MQSNNDWRYAGAARKVTLSGQLFFNGVHKSYFSWFVGTGPYWLDVDAEVGKGFIYNMPEGAMTAHSGAQMHLSRLGLRTTTGIRFFVGPITMGVRLHVLAYHAKTRFDRIENPLLVLEYKPPEIRSYQEAVSEFRHSPSLTIHVGIAFETKK
jgi:hypothetical protein